MVGAVRFIPHVGFPVQALENRFKKGGVHLDTIRYILKCRPSRFQENSELSRGSDQTSQRDREYFTWSDDNCIA